MSLSCQGEPIRVLLVEDNHGDAVLFRKCLKKSERNFVLEVIHDGEEALARLCGQSHGDKPLPQVVIMDLNLPRVSGQELLKELKMHAELKSVPLLVLTSSDDEEDVRQCYENGATCVLIKATNLDGVEKLVTAIQLFWIDTVCFPVDRKKGASP